MAVLRALRHYARMAWMGQRPQHVKAPDYLSKSPPLPVAAKAENGANPAALTSEAQQNFENWDPTRYGDWEIRGVAVDF
jgi:hypothetical protein